MSSVYKKQKKKKKQEEEAKYQYRGSLLEDLGNQATLRFFVTCPRASYGYFTVLFFSGQKKCELAHFKSTNMVTD